MISAALTWIWASALAAPLIDHAEKPMEIREILLRNSNPLQILDEIPFSLFFFMSVIYDSSLPHVYQKVKFY